MTARNATIDSLKLVAIFFVIVIHSFPLLFEQDQRLFNIGLLLNQVARFAVPGFFLVSGYLFATSFNFDHPGQRLSRTAKRLLTLYLFWCVFYMLPYAVARIPAGGWRAPWDFTMQHYYLWTLSWQSFLFGGSKAPLWFLPALLCSAVISTPFIHARRTGYLLIIGLILYGVALLSGPYQQTPIGFDIGFYSRNGPFFGTVFFASGAFMALNPGEPGRRLAIAYVLTGVGLVWHLTESFWLIRHYEGLTVYDFNAGTLAFGVGAGMLGIYGARVLQVRWLVENGRYSLGIYLLHLFVMDFLVPLNVFLLSSLLWQLAMPFLVMVLTLALVKYLMRYAICRKLLS